MIRIQKYCDYVGKTIVFIVKTMYNDRCKVTIVIN